MKELHPSLRLLADENVSLKLVKRLSGRGYDIKIAEGLEEFPTPFDSS